MDLLIMTFNLRYDNPEDGENSWSNRKAKAAEIIKQEQPAIIGTQELLPAMIKDLDELLTEYNWFGQPRQSNDEHSAIFYKKDKVELVKSGTFWLSETPTVEASISWDSALPRICTWGEFICLGSAQKFRVFNTHLDHISEEARIKGVRVIEAYMDALNKSEPLPAILTGDFNAEPASDEVKFWKDKLFTSIYSVMKIQGAGLTFHDFEGGFVGEPIDYIFVSKNIKIESGTIIHSKVENGYPSDHYPVSAIVKI
ncbi:endonuclease/exonuclease/phosphatase family protein [Bacillus sp. S3]|uniref:endonuclease/exonuclease/phosphatase family protein n=1 Tax=Bacillus sp. S3 TaxID=486398 RepID=UPI001188B09A|nr:endonuclease/exonuclease/phosphatase family protein [Bacillus sp. S3]QCJ44313.1 endonuclease/exonuclease/phosphatase family protein [Bacillus sp. S3]